MVEHANSNDDGIQSNLLVLRGKRVRENADGLVSLDDIWEISNSPITRSPKHWKAKRSTKRLVDVLQKKVTISYFKEKKRIIPVIYAKRGRGNSGTWAHPVLAAAYAGYLSPKLEIEVREVWIRFRAADAALADEILSGASDADNLWAAARANGRVERRRFTDALKRAQVTPRGYSRCTNAIYGRLFDKTAAQLKRESGTSITRDGMNVSQLSQVMLSESMASERIEYEACLGDAECAEASIVSAGFIREAIEREKASRVRRRGAA